MTKLAKGGHPELLFRQVQQADDLVSWYERRLDDLWTVAHTALADQIDPHIMRDQITAAMRAFCQQSHSKSLILDDWNEQVAKLGVQYRDDVDKCFALWAQSTSDLPDMGGTSELAATTRQRLFDCAMAAHRLLDLGLIPVKSVLQQYVTALNRSERKAGPGKRGRPCSTLKPQRDARICERYDELKGTSAERRRILAEEFEIEPDTIYRIVKSGTGSRTWN